MSDKLHDKLPNAGATVKIVGDAMPNVLGKWTVVRRVGDKFELVRGKPASRKK